MTYLNSKSANTRDDAYHLLLIDDDQRIRDLLSQYLKENGYKITTADSAANARHKLNSISFDLLVLDVMMPGESGISFAKSLRKTSLVPILMLTAKSETIDKINGLETGVDDYLVKPFEPRELVLRIQAILKRNNLLSGEKPKEVCFGPFTFNFAKNVLLRENEVVKLTEREKQTLAVLANRPSQTILRSEFETLFNGINERTIDVQINRIRRKIESDPSNPIYLQAVRGLGYRLYCDMR